MDKSGKNQPFCAAKNIAAPGLDNRWTVPQHGNHNAYLFKSFSGLMIIYTSPLFAIKSQFTRSGFGLKVKKSLYKREKIPKSI